MKALYYLIKFGLYSIIIITYFDTGAVITMIDIRLVTFITVAKIKSFTKSGELLNLTQPAVSQHIKYLEEYYNGKLIEHRGKQIHLTEEGKLLLRYAEDLEILHRNLEREMRNKSYINKNYYIGATMTIGGYVMAEILAEHKKLYKNINLILKVSNTQDIIKHLLGGKIDLAIVEGTFQKGKFNYKKLKDDELVLAVSTNSSFSLKKQVTIEEVLKGNLILREKGSGTREIFENKIQDMGYDIKDIEPYMEIGSITAIKSLVEKNLGYTIISKETIKREVEMGTIKIIPIENIRIYREFNFIYLKDKDSEFIQKFIGFCLEK